MSIFYDLTGQRFGNLVVLGLAEKENGKINWKCICDCGKETIVSTSKLRSGHTKSCGCMRHNSPKNKIDLSGKKFGRLTVLEPSSPHITSGGANIAMWKCQCDCGKFVNVSSQKLRKGTTISCGCLKGERLGRIRFEDLTGKRFGRLTVIRFLKKGERQKDGYNWLCQCDCGKLINANASKLKSGHTKSCGCLIKEHIGNLNRKYKNTCKRLYSVYKSMISRCFDEKHREYNNYGGRGITVCEQWLGEYGFDNFSEWAYISGYDEKAKSRVCTLDRKDVDGNYNPDNCRWITNKQQQNNRRNCVYIEHDGDVKTIAEWAEELNISYSKAYRYLREKGKTVQQVIDEFL